MARGCEVRASNLRLVNGVSAGLEALGWALADPGEVVLVPVPTYARSDNLRYNCISCPHLTITLTLCCCLKVFCRHE